jgi:hypothetical protein
MYVCMSEPVLWLSSLCLLLRFGLDWTATRPVVNHVTFSAVTVSMSRLTIGHLVAFVRYQLHPGQQLWSNQDPR